jgi:hypothetical protein
MIQDQHLKLAAQQEFSEGSSEKDLVSHDGSNETGHDGKNAVNDKLVAENSSSSEY